MKKRKYLIIGVVLLVILIAVPTVERYVLGMTLRQVPGALIQPQATEAPAETAPLEDSPAAPDDYTDIAITADYGYYPDDKWTEKQCGFYVTAPAAGEIILNIYYPFEVTGDQVGHVYLEGQLFQDFVVSGDNFEVRVPCSEGQHYIQIDSDFAKEPGIEDKRALAFVLSGVAFQTKEKGGAG